MSFFRLVLVPFIMYAYICLREYYLTAGLVLFSALTDVLDGFLARKYNWVSDFGKFLDPFADKVTQAAMILCLLTRYAQLRLLIKIFVIKEFLQGVCVLIAVHKSNIFSGSRWYGKVSTFLLYTMCLILILFPDINRAGVDAMTTICTVMLAVALVGYTFLSFKLAFGKPENKKSEEPDNRIEDLRY